MYNIIERAKNGDHSSLDEAVRMNSGLVWSVVRRIPKGRYEDEDLYQIGVIGLIKAIRRFDPSYKVKFSTYAVPLIAGEIKRFLRDDGIIKVSRRYKEIAYQASAVSKRLAEVIHREPTISEIASEMDTDVYTLSEALEACAPCDSIYRTYSDDGHSEMYLLDKISGDDGSSLFDKTSLKCALATLGNRERTIIICRYFLDETQSKVAQRLGISQVQVSRIEKKVIGYLRENLSECG